VPVSPDRILGLNATPVPRSGTGLPNFHVGFLCSSHPCERVFRLSAGRLSSTSRFPSTSLQPRGISAPPRPGDGFGFITCRLLRSANYPCRLRATVHPDRLPSSIRNPGLLSLLRVDSHRSTVLRRCSAGFLSVASNSQNRWSCYRVLRFACTACALTSTRTAPGQVTVLTRL